MKELLLTCGNAVMRNGDAATVKIIFNTIETILKLIDV